MTLPASINSRRPERGFARKPSGAMLSDGISRSLRTTFKVIDGEGAERLSVNKYKNVLSLAGVFRHPSDKGYTPTFLHVSNSLSLNTSERFGIGALSITLIKALTAFNHFSFRRIAVAA